MPHRRRRLNKGVLGGKAMYLSIVTPQKHRCNRIDAKPGGWRSVRSVPPLWGWTSNHAGRAINIQRLRRWEPISWRIFLKINANDMFYAFPPLLFSNDW